MKEFIVKLFQVGNHYVAAFVRLYLEVVLLVVVEPAVDSSDLGTVQRSQG